MDNFRIPYELWLRIAPLIPAPAKKHRFGGGRPRVADYQVMNGIFFVLRTGCQWKALDATAICSGSTAHSRFQEWRRAGLFARLWGLGLEHYDATMGIDWEWLSMDGATTKAPLAGTKKRAEIRPIEANAASSVACSPRPPACRWASPSTAPTVTT